MELSISCVLLYVAYGKREYKIETLASIASWYENTKFPFTPTIYTDEPTFFTENLSFPDGFKIKEIPLEKLTEWKGLHQFNHRIKIKAIENALAEGAEKVLLVDTDTIFTSTPSKLFDKISESQVLFWQLEGRLDSFSSELYTQMVGHFRSVSTSQFPGPHPSDIGKWPMWNSGIVGIHASHKHAIFLAFKWVDVLYPIAKNHLIEQLSLGLALSNENRLLPSYKYVIHYWNYKPFAENLVSLFENGKLKWKNIETSETFSQVIKIYRPSLWVKLKYVFLTFLSKVFPK